jgi:pheromone shutdown-related protein TraB
LSTDILCPKRWEIILHRASVHEQEEYANMSGSVTRISLGEREFILLGTAHISRESVDEVKTIISTEKPDRICVEIDESRYKSLTQADAWKNLNITQVLRQGKGFLLMSNLVLASFQKRLGLDLGVKPGAEMIEAVKTAQQEDIPFSLCDREIQITLKRAWSKSGFFAKLKMLAVMLASIFTSQKLSEEEIEKLKKKNVLENMLEEISEFLPSVKEVLIDERDVYLATRVYQSTGTRVVAVVGAGHVPGMINRLQALDTGEASEDIAALDEIPPKNPVVKSLPWIVPVAIVGAIVAGFIVRGSDVTLPHIYRWVLINGTLSAIGALVALAHPLTIVLAFAAAPFTSLVPVIGVGILTGILEGTLRKPRVADFENLQDDIASFRGFFKNRFTHVLIVFMLSNIGSSVGTFIGGIPLFASLFG